MRWFQVNIISVADANAVSKQWIQSYILSAAAKANYSNLQISLIIFYQKGFLDVYLNIFIYYNHKISVSL